MIYKVYYKNPDLTIDILARCERIGKSQDYQITKIYRVYGGDTYIGERFSKINAGLDSFQISIDEMTKDKEAMEFEDKYPEEML